MYFEIIFFIVAVIICGALISVIVEEGIWDASHISGVLFMSFRYGAPAFAAAGARFTCSSCSRISSLSIEDYNAVFLLGAVSTVASIAYSWWAGHFIGTGIMTGKRKLGVVFLVFTVVSGIASTEYLVTPTMELLRNRWEAEGGNRNVDAAKAAGSAFTNAATSLLKSFFDVPVSNEAGLTLVENLASYFWGSNAVANSWAVLNPTCFAAFERWITVCRLLIVLGFAGGLVTRIRNIRNLNLANMGEKVAVVGAILGAAALAARGSEKKRR